MQTLTSAIFPVPAGVRRQNIPQGFVHNLLVPGLRHHNKWRVAKQCSAFYGLEQLLE